MLSDGNCQFRSLSKELFRTADHHAVVREVVTSHMIRNHADYVRVCTVQCIYTFRLPRSFSWLLCFFVFLSSPNQLSFSNNFTYFMMSHESFGNSCWLLCSRSINVSLHHDHHHCHHHRHHHHRRCRRCRCCRCFCHLSRRLWMVKTGLVTFYTCRRTRHGGMNWPCGYVLSHDLYFRCVPFLSQFLSLLNYVLTYSTCGYPFELCYSKRQHRKFTMSR